MRGTQTLFGGEELLSSYNHEDLEEGLYYILYYGGGVSMAGTPDHLLRSFVWTADPGSSSITGITDLAATLQQDLDFDIEFNLSHSIGGDCLINLKHYTKSEGTTDTDTYTVVTIYHYDGSTETSIGTATTDTIHATGSTGATATEAIKISITEKDFKKGDILRINLKQYCWRADTAETATCTLYHNPLSDPADLRCWIPFKIKTI